MPIKHPFENLALCPVCGGKAVWRNGAMFEHQRRCVSKECGAYDPDDYVSKDSLTAIVEKYEDEVKRLKAVIKQEKDKLHYYYPPQ